MTTAVGLIRKLTAATATKLVVNSVIKIKER